MPSKEDSISTCEILMLGTLILNVKMPLGQTDNLQKERTFACLQKKQSSTPRVREARLQDKSHANK